MIRYFKDFGKRVYIWWLKDWGNVTEECEENPNKWYVLLGEGSEILVDKKDCETDTKLITKDLTRVYDSEKRKFGTIKNFIQNIYSKISYDDGEKSSVYHDIDTVPYQRQNVWRVSKAFENWYEENKDLLKKNETQQDFTELEKTLLENTDNKYKYLYRAWGGALFLSDQYVDDPIRALLYNTTSFKAYSHLFNSIEENSCVKFRN